MVYPLIFFTVSNGLNASFASVCFQDFFLSRSRVIVRKFNVNSSLTGLKCKGQNSPAHGSLTCHEDTTAKEVSCTLKCDHGYDVEFLAAERYVCNTDGTWRAQPLSTGSQWPNCKKYRWICTEKYFRSTRCLSFFLLSDLTATHGRHNNLRTESQPNIRVSVFVDSPPFFFSINRLISRDINQLMSQSPINKFLINP